MRQLQWTAFFVLLFALVWTGCKKDSGSPTQSQTGGISGDIFPIVQGHSYVFNEYDLDDNNARVAGTDHRVVWTIGPTISYNGRTASIVIDSSYGTTGIVTSVDTFFVSKDGSGNVSMVLSPGQRSITSLVSIPNSWMPFFSVSSGLETSYPILTMDTSITVPASGLVITANLHIALSGIFHDKAAVQVPLGSFDAYKVDANINMSASSGSLTLMSYNGILLSMWLSGGVGPVKTNSPTVNQTMYSATGYEMVLVSKNF